MQAKASGHQKSDNLTILISGEGKFGVEHYTTCGMTKTEELNRNVQSHVNQSIPMRRRK
jgi:hypothetical protein